MSSHVWFVVIPLVLVVPAVTRGQAPLGASPAPATEAQAAEPASYGWRESALVSRSADGTELRSNPLVTMRVAESPTPEVIAGVLVACSGHVVYTLDPATLVVRARRSLPGRCAGLEEQGSRVVVRVVTREGGPALSTRIRIDPADPERILGFPTGLGLVAARSRAHVIDLGTATTAEGRARAMREPVRRSAVATALTEVDRRLALDRTNPFFDIERGHLLTALGRVDDASLAYAHALEHDPVYDIDLVMVSAELDFVSPALANRAFDRGIAAWIRAGFEPDLAFSIVPALLALGPADMSGSATERFERLAVRAERLAALSPRSEGVAGFFEAMRLEAHRLGDSREGRYTELRDAAAWTRLLGPLPWEGRLAGHALNALLGLVVAILASFVVALVKARGLCAPLGASRFRRLVALARFGLPVRLGFAIAAVAMFAVGTVAAYGVSEIGLVASAPDGFIRGTMSDPATVAFTRVFDGTSEGELVRGFVLQRAGEPRAALRAYERSTRPEALVNRGVLLASHGDAVGARRAFERAHAMDPHLAEAAIDLGRSASSPRVRRLQASGVSSPLIAIPTVDALGLAMRGAVAKGHSAVLHNPIRATASLFALVGLSQDEVASSEAYLVYVILGLVLLIVIVPGYRVSWEPTGKGRLGWALGLLVPGGSRAYGPFGVLVTGCFVTMCIGAYTLANSGGVGSNMLELVATPSLERYFGITTAVVQGEESIARTFYGAWWVLLAAHVAFVAVTERRFRDPLRAPASKT